MEDLRSKMTYAERMDLQMISLDMREYIIPVLLEKQNGVCDICKQKADYYDIDHLIYNPDITINELRLLCVPCHKSVTDYRPMKYRQ